MPRRLSPQTRFLLRASMYFAGSLAVWWFLLLAPLLAWTRIATDVLLNGIPGAPLDTGVTVAPGKIWVLQAPVPAGSQWRNVRLETAERLPAQLTVGLPLFWAIVLAAPRPRRLRWILLGGSAALLLVPPLGLLLYAAHVVQLYVYPNTPALPRAAIAAADYMASTVVPYVLPVLLALALHGELREAVLAFGQYSGAAPRTIPPV